MYCSNDSYKALLCGAYQDANLHQIKKTISNHAYPSYNKLNKKTNQSMNEIKTGIFEMPENIEERQTERVKYVSLEHTGALVRDMQCISAETEKKLPIEGYLPCNNYGRHYIAQHEWNPPQRDADKISVDNQAKQNFGSTNCKYRLRTETSGRPTEQEKMINFDGREARSFEDKHIANTCKHARIDSQNILRDLDSNTIVIFQENTSPNTVFSKVAERSVPDTLMQPEMSMVTQEPKNIETCDQHNISRADFSLNKHSSNNTFNDQTTSLNYRMNMYEEQCGDHDVLHADQKYNVNMYASAQNYTENRSVIPKHLGCTKNSQMSTIRCHHPNVVEHQVDENQRPYFYQNHGSISPSETQTNYPGIPAFDKIVSCRHPSNPSNYNDRLINSTSNLPDRHILDKTHYQQIICKQFPSSNRIIAGKVP